MAAGRRDFQCPLDVFLALHVGKVGRVLVHGVLEQVAGIDLGGRYVQPAFEEVDGFLHAAHGNHVEVVDDGRFLGVLLRQHNAPEALLAGLNGNGQYPANGPQIAIERHFTHDDVVAQRLGLQLLRGVQNAQRNGQVVGRTLLADVGRGHVHHHFGARHAVAPELQRRLNALLALLDGVVGQAHHVEVRPGRDHYLNGDGVGVDALHGRAEGFGKHEVG